MKESVTMSFIIKLSGIIYALDVQSVVVAAAGERSFRYCKMLI
jgi:hypothetical protein